jgi:hypothetical protein
MARSGQRRGSTVTPARDSQDDDVPYQPRFSPLSDFAIAQLQTLRFGANDFEHMVATAEGKDHFDQILRSIDRELSNRAGAGTVSPGAYLRSQALSTIMSCNTDPVDAIPTRYAALCLSCLADQETVRERKMLNVTVAAVAFALAGDAHAAGYLLDQHEIDLDELPLSSRFAIATMVPEMRGQLINAFAPDSPEFQVLSMIEHNASHVAIRNLYEDIVAKPKSNLERLLFGLAKRRLFNYAYRSSMSSHSRADSRPPLTTPRPADFR